MLGELHPGHRVAGRYEIVARAGAGGMGTVYRAIDRTTGGGAAVKIVRIADPTDEVRFEREAAALGLVDDPAVVRYLAHGRDTGMPFLVMEWLAGHTLDAQLDDTGLSPAETIELAARVARGLAAVHARGVVHRDIKPSNLMLVGGQHDRPAILDFGAARASDRAIVTHTGCAVGTPGYMSPEQARGDRILDARSDVFSFGCVLYECLAGRMPFPGERRTAVCTKILLHEPPPLDAPRELAELVEDCLRKDPARRPADGAELVRRIAALPPLDPSAPRRRPYRAVATQRADATPADAILSIVLARPDRDMTVGLRAAARRFGARIDMLGDGTLVIEVARGGAAVHAQLVSTLASYAGAGVLVVASGRVNPDAPDAVLERAARVLDREVIAAALADTITPRMRPSSPAIITDDETVALLSPPLDAILCRTKLH